ncbi:DAK2 domain-containing protein [Photobacterium nomapromontoriensis]|uniref:DAK2 domain-containing protein n=1 Tax=Photobacterium nomapromontoriensis TaxID=2910237 RepID=UPI003D0D9B40
MDTFNAPMFYRMLDAATIAIGDNAAWLNELDGKTGDGDHGTTMLRVKRSIEEMLIKADKAPVSHWQQAIDDLGWSILSQDGGSAGMLIGNLFIGLAEGLTEEQLSPQQTAAAFRAGLDKMRHFSGAQQGDKTMLDALIPAVSAMESAANQPQISIDTLFRIAAQAADEGAQATIAMKPTRGRAKNMGERAIGLIDPGATSMSLVFGAFSSVSTPELV